MRILLITPGINKKYNDNYYSYRYISRLGNPILAISNIENINKGGGLETSSTEENVDNDIKVYRIFKTIKEQTGLFYYSKQYIFAKSIIHRFKPEIIFCENTMNIHLGRQIKNDFKIPLVLRVEFAYHRSRPYRYLGRDRLILSGSIFDRIGMPVALGYWKWICRQIDGLISCYFDDIPERADNATTYKNHSRTSYIPWPTHLPLHNNNIPKDKGRAIYIGAFETHKNMDEFLHTIPALFQSTPLKQFYIIGTGESGYVVSWLKSNYGDRIIHVPAMERNECLRAIAESYFTYAPARWGGWGLIGDSWAMRTPIVVTNNHYDFRNNVDSVVTDRDRIVQDVNRLYDDPLLYKSIQEEGYMRFKRQHRSNLVGEQYYAVMRKTLTDWRRSR